jgi:3-isopropylmalate dehydrogenase
MRLNIAVIPGDGIGPEVTYSAEQVLTEVARICGHDLRIDHVKACSQAIEECGRPLPEESLKACLAADAVILGNTGLERYKNERLENRPEYALLRLRKELGVTTNIRPVRLYPRLKDLSPLKNEMLSAGLDYVFVRDIAGGVLCSEQVEGNGSGGLEAYEQEYYNQKIVEKTAHFAFRLAKGRKGRVVSLDKANVLGSSRLWRKTVTSIAREYPGVELTHEYIDAAALKLINSPQDYDVILTCNIFGDIISDEGTGLTGTGGLFASAELSEDGKGLYTPNQLHYPDESVIGQQKVSPVGLIMSEALMLRCTFGLEKEAAMIEAAVASVLDQGVTTADMAYPEAEVVPTSEMASRIAKSLQR